MKTVALLILALSSVSAAPAGQTFVGVINDATCAKDGHKAMGMGPTDAECAVACVDSHGVPYVLQVGQEVYGLSDQRAPEKLAGQRVRVVGSLDAGTKKIQVESIAAMK